MKNKINLKNNQKLKSNKNQELLMNYVLTLGFIFMIIFFISSIILISRFVFVGTALGDHVKITKELIGDISKVENDVINNNNSINFDSENFYNLNPISSKILSFSYLNTNKNQSYLTIKLNNTINEENNYLYIRINNISKLIKNSLILYWDSEEERKKKAKIISFEDNETYIYDLEDNDFKKVDINSIIGEIIYIKNN